MKTDMEIEQYLKSLGLSWINIAEAMSDDNRQKTINLLQKNPQIKKEEFLTEMEIEED